MKYASHLRRVVAVTVLSVLAYPAWATGTDANTPVVNAVTLNYNVNGFPQPAVTTDVTFLVDRALRVVVTNQDTDVVLATPGQTLNGNVRPLQFDVSNTSNATVDLLLGVVDRDATQVTGYPVVSRPAFNPTAVGLYLDDGTTPGVVDSGDTPLTAQGNYWVLPGVTEDQTVRVLVSIAVSNTTPNGQQATYTLVAAAANGGAVIVNDSNGRPTAGASAIAAVADDPNVVQDVFADIATTAVEDFVYNFQGAGSQGSAQDILSNGQHGDSGAFAVDAAELYMAKTVEVLWDPINLDKYDGAGATTGALPKAIPGAVVMYAIGVQNDVGSPTVTNLNIADNIDETVTEGSSVAVNFPANVSIDLNSVPVVFAVPAGASTTAVNYVPCGGTPTTAAFAADPEVAVSLGSCVASDTGLIVYLVTIPL